MHRSSLSRSCAVAVIALALGVLAACGPFGNDDATADRAGRALTAAEAEGALPSVGSLPKGWGVAKRNLMRPPSPAKDKVTPARCRPIDVDIASGYLGGKVTSFRSFLRGHVGMGIGIASYAEEAPGLDALRTAMKSCRTVTVRTPTMVQHGRVAALRIPSLGHDAVAIRIKVRFGNLSQTYDAIRVRVGHNWVMGDLATPGAARPNTKPLVTAMRNAILNLS